MVRDLGQHHRRSIRLKGYDYSQAGAYFVTVCTQDRACLFGDVVDGAMRLNEVGQIVGACWRMIPGHFPNTELDGFVVMPNHVHGIIVITQRNLVRATHASPLQQPPRGLQCQSISAIIGSFKSAATKRIHALPRFANLPIWQRNYYEHIIRNEESLNHIRQYILDNPAWWAFDRDNPAAHEPDPEDAWRL
jgi:REP element-mobilizing transposase RayT